MSEIKGYTPLSEEQKNAMNALKTAEELVLRIAEMQRDAGLTDPRSTAAGITYLQTAFMWLNRAVAKPQRIEGELEI